MPGDLEAIRRAYALSKEAAKSEYTGDDLSAALLHFAELSLKFLASECTRVDLKSLVPGKSYVSYIRKTVPSVISRSVNTALFDPDPARAVSLWNDCMAGRLSAGDLARVSYTVALAPCLAMELFDRQNKKGPATYFELLIGHIFSKALGVNPQRKVTLPVKGENIALTMDFIFHLKSGGVRVHLPVKMSTRERVVQAWAHQRILDAAHGENRYRGIMVLFSETKLGLKEREVVEICVPKQWLVYQAYLSRMHRIYYFDVPAVYGALTERHPDLIQIKQFGEFFTEKEEVVRQ